MTPERWEQIHDVLQKALELAPGERSAFLNQACSSDQSLRQEVETLLASSDDVRSQLPVAVLRAASARSLLGRSWASMKSNRCWVRAGMGRGVSGPRCAAGAGCGGDQAFCRRLFLQIPIACGASSRKRGRLRR